MTPPVAGRPAGILFGLVLSREQADADPLEELATLAAAAGIEVAGRVWQRREAPDRAWFLGKGKARELAALAAEAGAEVAICDQDLSPAQGRNLEELLKVRVLDRTELILDLFATQARTSQAQAQVELARLEYALPRLRGRWSHLDRERGGIGMRGAGEKQIEADRRLIERRIQELKRILIDLARRAARLLESRRGWFRACLVGYASAGKSSLLNVLAGADALVAARPFSTLDTCTRTFDLGGGLQVLLSDTVGFIRDIPHHLVASFHATLAEAVHADLLLHVVDVSRESFLEEIAVVDEVLGAIGAGQVPRLLLLNKVDLLADRGRLALARRRDPQALAVSALTGEGMDEVRRALTSRLFPIPVRVVVEIPLARSGLAARVRTMAEIRREEWGEDGVRLELRTSAEMAARLGQDGARILEISAAESAGESPGGDGVPPPPSGS